MGASFPLKRNDEELPCFLALLALVGLNFKRAAVVHVFRLVPVVMKFSLERR